ncbi:MAG TPA: hypothetical protein VE783_02205 [Candidatus Limnocylindrales bacterium]|jgi:hypothetical protein|nr:hypothetical protein [Candidatus Limnocylindrales bacterium]
MRGFQAFGVFLFFGSSMATLAAVTLLLPGTFLDRAWALNPVGHQQLSLVGRSAGLFFGLLASVLATAGIGWFRRRLWAWWIAAIVISLQVAGNIGGIIAGQALRGIFGVTVALLLLIYLLRTKTQAFAPAQTSPR